MLLRQPPAGADHRGSARAQHHVVHADRNRGDADRRAGRVHGAQAAVADGGAVAGVDLHFAHPGAGLRGAVGMGHVSSLVVASWPFT